MRRTSVDLPGGSVRTGSGEVILRARGKRYDAERFAEVVVQTREDGSVVRLGEIAEVIDGFEDVDLEASFDGRPAIIVNVFRTGEQDTLHLADMVESYLDDLQERLPEGVTVEVWNDQSQYLRGRLNLLAKNATVGLALVLLVLTLFLRPSLAFLVALGIPVSFAGGIWMMPHVGIAINMISLFAFILVLGIVVDDAIVVGERVYTRIQQGEHPRDGERGEGTHEVGVVVIFGVLTTMMAFTPMLGLSGVSGKIWPNIPLVVIPVLLFSLLQSKLVLPAHLALLSPTDRSKKVNIVFRLQRRIADGLETFIKKVYQPTLARALRWRYVVAALFIAGMFGVAGLVGGGWVKTQFFPEVEGDISVGQAGDAARGALRADRCGGRSRSRRRRRRWGRSSATAGATRWCATMLATSGTQPFQFGFDAGGPKIGSHLGEVTVELVPSVDRDLGADDLVGEWRKLVGRDPGCGEPEFPRRDRARRQCDRRDLDRQRHRRNSSRRWRGRRSNWPTTTGWSTSPTATGSARPSCGSTA